MRYLHYVTDQNGNQIESVYSSKNTPKISMESLAKIKKTSYKIWDRETNKVKTL